MGNYQDLVFYQKARLAEGHGRHLGAEYIHYLIIAQGSANETEHWLHTAQDCELGPSEKVNEILKLNNEVIRMITSSISTIRVNQGTRNLREYRTNYLIDPDPINEE